MSKKMTARIASWLIYFLHLSFTNGGQRNNDIILGGFFSEHFPVMSPSGQHTHSKRKDYNPCEERNRRATADKLAMEFAVSEINQDENILPGIWLGTNMKDTCSDLDYAVNNTLDYQFIKDRFINTSNQCAAEKNETSCCLARKEEAPLVAIVAGAYSHIVKAIVNLVGLFKVPVIGYSSTSPSLNKMDYFLRTVPPDTVSTQIMVDVIKELRWNIVLVLYVNNEFGHYAADCFRTALRRLNAKICIAYDDKFSIDSKQEEIDRVVAGIKKATKSKVIAFFGTIEDFVYLQKHINSTLFDVNEYIWLSPELWVRSDLHEIPKTIKHILTIGPGQYYPRERLIHYLRSRGDLNNTCSHISGRMKFQYGFVGNLIVGQNCSFERTKYIPLVLDAVYAIAVGIHEMLGCQAGKSCREKLENMQRGELLCFLKNLNFLNHHTNNTISFDANGNPRSTHYTVLKLEVGNKTYKSTVIGNWSCRTNNTTCERNLSRSSIEALNPGWFNSSCGPNCRPGSIRALQEEFPDCCWECQECTGNQYSNSSNQLKCLECPDDQWPDSKHTSCVEIEHDYLDTLRAPGILILIWNCLGMAVILVTAGVFLKYGSSHIVRASSRQLSFLLLLGISVDFALLMALLREPNASQCAAVFVLTHAANCLVSGTLFLKTNRIHRIFRKSAMKEHPRCLGNTSQLVILAVLVLIDVTLAVTVLVFSPKNGEVKVTYVMQGESKKAFVLCYYLGTSLQNDILQVLLWSYECGLIFICTYQAYLVRKVPENYNEARYITFTMVTMSMNLIIYVITTSGMEGKNLVLVYCIFQSLKATVALGCMFFPKVYVILFCPEKNVPHNPVQSKLGTFVEDTSVGGAKVDDTISSGSSVQTSGFSEPSPGDTGGASVLSLSRPYRKVGVKMKEEGPVEKFDSVSDFDGLRASEQDVLTHPEQVVKRSVDIVLVNDLATSNSTA